MKKKTILAVDMFCGADGDLYSLDIRFRMLLPHELAAAQGFPQGYKFAGNRQEIVKQIGNAVPVNTAKSLCMSQFVA